MDDTIYEHYIAIDWSIKNMAIEKDEKEVREWVDSKLKKLNVR